MKKVFLVLLITVLSFSLFSCGKKTQEEVNNDPQYEIYKLAKDAGYEGTYEEWLASIKGDKGDKGEAGKSAYELYLKAHPEYQKSEEEWLDDLANNRLGKEDFELEKRIYDVVGKVEKLSDDTVPVYFFKNSNVPYLGINALLNLTSTLLPNRIEYDFDEEEQIGTYTYSVDEKDYVLTIDWLNDKMEANSFDFFTYLYTENDPQYTPCMQEVSRSISGDEKIVLDLGKDSIDIIYYDEDILVQPDVLNAIFLSSEMYNLVYAGERFGFFEGYGNSAKTNDFFNSMYNDTQMPWDLRRATMNGLVFILNNYYGLKEYQNIDEFRDEIGILGAGFDLPYLLNSANPERFSKGYSTFYYTYLDDPHTTLVTRSIFNKDMYYENHDEGFRSTNLHNRYLDSITKYQETFGLTEDAMFEPYQIRYSGSTAFIRFDSFTEDIFTYVKDRLDEAREYNKLHNNVIKNVVIDLTSNLGGAIYDMYSLFGLMTDEDIFAPTINSQTKAEIRQTFKVDADLDGDYTDNDAYTEFKYNLLISKASFSAANYMPAIAKGMKYATIIGEKSAGGMCAVGTHSLLDGSVAKISSAIILAGVNQDGKFYLTEDGVEPDYEISKKKFYDLAYIDNFINNGYKA